MCLETRFAVEFIYDNNVLINYITRKVVHDKVPYGGIRL